MSAILAEPVYEMCFDGELGSVIGYHIDGHIDLARTDELMAAIEDEFGDGPERGWDITHTWVRNVAAFDDEDEEIDGAWSYAYSDTSSPDARAVTLVHEESTWRYRCVNHPDETATTGRPRSIILDGQSIVQTDPQEWEQVCDDSYVYQCRACANDFEVRLREASRAAMDGVA